VTLLIFYTCFSIFSVPLMSLSYEMTADYQERTTHAAFVVFSASSASSLTGWVFWAANLAIFGSSCMACEWWDGRLRFA